MSEIKETKKKAAPKKTAAKKETVKKETVKKTTAKKTTAKKTTTTKKATPKKATKPVEEKVVVTEEVKVEPIVEEAIPVVEEPVAEVSEPQVEIEIPQVVSEPTVEEPIMETQPVYEESISEPVVETPAAEEPVMPIFEPLPPVEEGYKARPISEIMANTQEEPVTESYIDSQVVEPVEAAPVIEDQVMESQVTEPVVFDTTTEVEKQESVQPTDEPEQPMYEEMPSMESTLASNESQPVITKQKKPIDKRTLLLILLFVALFAFIMFMPQIQDAINSVKKNTGMSEIERKAKEIEKKQNQENDTTPTDNSKKEQYSKLTCTSTTTALDDYDRTVVETFEYNTKKEVMTSAKKITYKFVAANASYENLKTQCNENSLKYVDKKGYEIACNYNETEVVMEDKFDLAVFSTIKDGTTIISANAKYKDKIDSIKTRLEALDYTCE